MVFSGSWAVSALIKKKIKFSSYIRKFRVEQLQSHIWLTASSYCIWGNKCAFPHILGSPSSYMTLQLLHSEFPYMCGIFDFLFYQCVGVFMFKGPLKWITERICINNNFIEAKRKKMKTISVREESTNYNFFVFNKNIHLFHHVFNRNGTELKCPNMDCINFQMPRRKTPE